MPIRFAPSPKAPPWSYNFSEILRPPKAGQTVADVVARIRLFHRDGLLILGARILWQFWNNRELTNPTTPEGVGNYITWVNAERIISLGCTCASTTHRPFPKEVDFRLLCWELHGSLDTLSVASAKERGESDHRVPAPSAGRFSSVAIHGSRHVRGCGRSTQEPYRCLSNGRPLLGQGPALPVVLAVDRTESARVGVRRQRVCSVCENVSPG
jgi:hypothetical protein